MSRALMCVCSIDASIRYVYYTSYLSSLYHLSLYPLVHTRLMDTSRSILQFAGMYIIVTNHDVNRVLNISRCNRWTHIDSHLTHAPSKRSLRSIFYTFHSNTAYPLYPAYPHPFIQPSIHPNLHHQLRALALILFIHTYITAHIPYAHLFNLETRP